MKWLLVLFAAFALTASAADVAGTWKASMETPNGSMDNTFVFKVDGTTLTGTMGSEMMGERPISDGKVDGDNLTWSVKMDFGGNAVELKYKAKVTGTEMKITMTFSGPDGERNMEMTAKKTA